MDDQPRPDPSDSKPTFSALVGEKAAKKLRARQDKTHGVWFGLGMMGLIGWSVVTPTLLGAALGIWLDERFPGKRTWTLTLLIAGLAIGCMNAWLWVLKEDKAMHKKRENPDE